MPWTHMPRSQGEREHASHLLHPLTLLSAHAGFDLFDDERNDEKRMNASIVDASDFIVDTREWDVPYHVRVMIDRGMSLATTLDRGLSKSRYTDR